MDTVPGAIESLCKEIIIDLVQVPNADRSPSPSSKCKPNPNSLSFPEIYDKNVSVKEETSPKKTSPFSSYLSTFRFLVTQVFLWSILFVFAVIPVGFGVQQALQISVSFKVRVSIKFI